MRFFRIILSICFLVISQLCIYFAQMTDMEYCMLMCLNFVFILLFAWRSNQLSPYFLFLITFIFLFIGGRFWGHLFDHSTYIRAGNFFTGEDLNWDTWKRTLCFILLFLHASTIGYMCIDRQSNNPDSPLKIKETTEYTPLDKFLIVVFCLLAPSTIFSIIHKFMVALQGGGYMSLYLNQADTVSVGSGFASSMLYVFFGIACIYGNTTTRKLFLILLLFKAIVFILIGQRARFGSLLLFILWYFYKDKQINLFKVAIVGGVALIVLLIVAHFSIRESNSDTYANTLPAFMGKFLHAQGVSLTTFACSQEIQDYPTIDYFVSFIPGIVSISSFLSPIDPQCVSFANYLAYSLNSTLFATGSGLGWTLLSDLYLYSGRFWLSFVLLSFLFGWVCRWLEWKSTCSPLSAAITYTIFLNFMFLPRSGLYNIIPLIVWLLIIYCILFKLLNIQHKYTIK